MQDKQQFEQLMMQYTQLRNGSLDIKRMIENEDFDSAITMIKTREPIFLNCKCMRKYLELTPEEETELNQILDELRGLELENIHMLEVDMAQVQRELKNTQKTEKIHQAYDIGGEQVGSIINYEE